MSEQLNERERYFVEAAFPFTGGLTFGAEERIRRAFAAAPPDPRDAELSALRAEVERLRNDGIQKAVDILALRLAMIDCAAGLTLVDIEKLNVKLRSEVERLNGLLDEVEAETEEMLIPSVDQNEVYMGMEDSEDGVYVNGRRVRRILSRRTAERKEPTNASD